MANGPRVFVVAQARMGSTRLPGKVLMELAGKPLVEWVMTRASKAEVDGVMLAIPELPEDDALGRLAEAAGWRLHRGSADDVQDRYLSAALRLQADHLVRLTCDNPFVDRVLINRLVRGHVGAGADYSSYHLRGPFPLGLAVEAVSVAALRKARGLAGEPHEKEHVTSGLYSRPGQFRIHAEEPPSVMRRADLRLTIDTKEDLDAMRKLVATAGPNPVAVSAEQYVELLGAHPEIRAMNAHVRQKQPGE
jgi:spore coat polysaccharide biosynthesis protein SpsF